MPQASRYRKCGIGKPSKLNQTVLCRKQGAGERRYPAGTISGMNKHWQRRQVGLTFLAVGAIFGLLSGCAYGPDGSKRGEVEVDSYTVEGTLVTLIVMSCDGDPKVDVAESDDEVRVSVISTTQKSGNGCQDPAQFELDNELGERPIIDEFNGAIITASN